MAVGLIGVFKLTICHQYPVRGVPRLLPNDSWDKLQPPCNPEQDEVCIENRWMDR